MSGKLALRTRGIAPEYRHTTINKYNTLPVQKLQMMANNKSHDSRCAGPLMSLVHVTPLNTHGILRLFWSNLVRIYKKPRSWFNLGADSHLKFVGRSKVARTDQEGQGCRQEISDSVKVQRTKSQHAHTQR